MTDNISASGPAPTNALRAFRESLTAAPVKKASRTVACFAEAYPDIEQGLKRDVTLKCVRESFNRAYGLNLNAQRFRVLLEAERGRRAQLDDSDHIAGEAGRGTGPSSAAMATAFGGNQ
jgi:hypothetical protein